MHELLTFQYMLGNLEKLLSVFADRFDEYHDFIFQFLMLIPEVP